MIRLNVFFTLREGASTEDVLAITNELVAKSRQDDGCLGYDLFQSTTNPKVFMFCESWENAEVLDKHSKTLHLTSAIPALRALTADGLKVESFEK